MWEKLTNAGEGKIQFEAQALSQRLHEFLNESGSQLSKVLFSPRELELMGQLASVYKQMIPVKGTTNPSGTAPMLAKIASGARQFAVAAARLLRRRPAWRGGGVWRRQGIDGGRQRERHAKGCQSVLWAAGDAAG